MVNLTETQSRKDDHIRICLDEKVQVNQITNGLEKYQFTHVCLPELDYQEIDINTTFFKPSIKYSFVNIFYDRRHGKRPIN